MNADLRHGNVFDMITLNAHRVYDLKTVNKFPPNKEKPAHNRDRKYWKTRWWAKRQTWAIAAWPAVCWVKHSALLECVCVSVCECFRGGRVAAEPTGALWVVPSQVFSLCLDTSSAALQSVSFAVAHLILLFLHSTFSSPVTSILFTSMFTLHYVCSCSSNDGWCDAADRIAARTLNNVMASSLKAVRPRVSFHLKQNSRKMFVHPNEAATVIMQPSHKNKC